MEVTAAASVPASDTSMYVACRTSLIAKCRRGPGAARSTCVRAAWLLRPES